MIEIKNLKKVYPNITPLKDVSTVINDGDVIAIIGPSGTGKSTLLRCLNLLEKPTGGQIIVNGTDITAKNCDVSAIRRKMGMVFQSFNLFGHQTVIENIMYAPVKLLGKSRQEAYDRGMDLLRVVGLAQKALNYPDELSGGQKQRVAIARALAMDPDTILFDEPTSALDPTMVGEVQSVIRELAKSGKTLLIVTHEMEFARQVSNRVFFMDEGGIYEDGSPEQIFEHPLKEKTRRFIEKLKVFEVTIDSRDFDFMGLNTDLENYCNKQNISRNDCHKLQSVMEELCRTILLPVYDEPDIKCTIEYAEKTGHIHIAVEYCGTEYDPKNSNNELALSILKGTTSGMTYAYVAEEKYANKVKIEL